MSFCGLLLLESLEDDSVLRTLRIVQRETWHPANLADFQPEIWTALTITGNASAADEVAERLSHAIKPRWYADLSTDDYTYIVFSGRVFKYRKDDQQARAEAQAHAVSVGVPPHQLDWGE
jgi:hypothetical protein